MASSATTSQGCQLKIGDGATPVETFNLVGLITDISGPSETVNQIEVTSLDSTAKEYIGGLEDGGEVSFNLRLATNNTYQMQLRTDMLAQTVRNFQLALNDSAGVSVTVISFAALVTSFGMSLGIDNPVGASCTLKVSGAVTYTVAT